jgi:microcompartment protein CcmL/EutN
MEETSQKPAIGLVELTSIARGVVAADAMVKKSPVKILRSHPVCPGKYIVLITGLVDDVKESMAAGVYYAGYSLVDSIIIPNLHEQLIPAIAGITEVREIESVGIIETFSVASTIIAADAACKAAEIRLMEVRIATGLGGKAFLTLTGRLHSVEAAVSAGVKAIESGLLVRKEIIPSPHKDMPEILL